MCSSGAFANFARSPAAQFRGAEGAHHGVAVTPALGAMRPQPLCVAGSGMPAAGTWPGTEQHNPSAAQSATPPTAHSLSQTDRAAASRWRAALRPRAGTSQWTHEPGAELSAARAPWRERCGRERASTPSPPTPSASSRRLRPRRPRAHNCRGAPRALVAPVADVLYLIARAAVLLRLL